MVRVGDRTLGILTLPPTVILVSSQSFSFIFKSQFLLQNRVNSPSLEAHKPEPFGTQTELMVGTVVRYQELSLEPS